MVITLILIYFSKYFNSIRNSFCTSDLFGLSVYMVSLKYSYDTIDDLRQIVEGWYEVLGHNDGLTKDDYEIKEYIIVRLSLRRPGTLFMYREFPG